MSIYTNCTIGKCPYCFEDVSLNTIRFHNCTSSAGPDALLGVTKWHYDEIRSENAQLKAEVVALRRVSEAARSFLENKDKSLSENLRTYDLEFTLHWYDALRAGQKEGKYE